MLGGCQRWNRKRREKRATRQKLKYVRKQENQTKMMDTNMKYYQKGSTIKIRQSKRNRMDNYGSLKLRKKEKHEK